MGSVPTSRVSLFERPCAAFVEGMLTGVFIGMVVAVTLATPAVRAATQPVAATAASTTTAAKQQSLQLKPVVLRSDRRLPSYDCQQARRNYEGAMAVRASTARDLDSRRSAMQVVCSFSQPSRGANSLNNMNMNVNDVLPNHKTCRDEQDLNCFRKNLRY